MMILKYLREYNDYRKSKKLSQYFELMRNENSIFSVLVQCLEHKIITPDQFQTIHVMYDDANNKSRNVNPKTIMPVTLMGTEFNDAMNKLISVDKEMAKKINRKKKQ